MIFPFSFKGQLAPLPYAAASLAVFFSQHLLTLVAFETQGAPLALDWRFFFIPFRSFVTQGEASNLTLILAFAYLLAVSWALAGLAFRRAANADISEWIAAAAIAPFIQAPVIAALCFLPPRSEDVMPTTGEVGTPGFRWMAAVHGMIAGMALTLLAVATSTLVFGTYGFGVFVVSPFVIGAATAYFANRTTDLGLGRTARLVSAATALGGIALVLAALEGIICIALAAPLGIGLALIGGLLGRAIAMSRQRRARHLLPGLALLPLAFALESVLPPEASFDTRQTILVAAPPALVWSSILRMDSIQEPLALPFRLGVAYPLSGQVLGEGVGALRHGEFSTGTARERVTEWIPDRKLAFVVLEDVPSMRELSPYDLHTPHLNGYFLTSKTGFELLERREGGTEVIEQTSHRLRLDPVLYWLPLARWMVHENNMRVLLHIRHQAEARFGVAER